MNHSKNEIIKKMMEIGDGSVSRKDVIAKGISPASFLRFVQANGLIKIRQGVYGKADGTVDTLFQLQKQYPKVVYSGATALFILGLTDRFPEVIEFTIPKGYRVRKENLDENVVYHIENNVNLFLLGNVFVETMYGNEICCFSKEKMVVEMIRKRDDYDSELFLKSIKTFLKGKDKNMEFLFRYSRMRKIEDKVYQILEALNYKN